MAEKTLVQGLPGPLQKVFSSPGPLMRAEDSHSPGLLRCQCSGKQLGANLSQPGVHSKQMALPWCLLASHPWDGGRENASGPSLCRLPTVSSQKLMPQAGEWAWVKGQEEGQGQLFWLSPSRAGPKLPLCTRGAGREGVRGPSGGRSLVGRSPGMTRCC